MTRPHPACSVQARLDTPLGPMLAAATAQGLAGLWFDGQAHHPGELALPHDASQRWIAATRDWLQRYWLGDDAGDPPALDLNGTAFQQAVWQALRGIGRGRTRSYAELAEAVGRPLAVRAVGAAVGRNPVSVLVPCHRVIGRDGSLTGYAGGLARKTSLLSHEGWKPATQHRLIG